MYVEHWCEEQYKTLTIGGPDFSHNEMVSSTEYVYTLRMLLHSFKYVFVQLTCFLAIHNL